MWGQAPITHTSGAESSHDAHTSEAMTTCANGAQNGTFLEQVRPQAPAMLVQMRPRVPTILA